jgi:hypothetical protein
MRVTDHANLHAGILLDGEFPRSYLPAENNARRILNLSTATGI